MILHPTPMTAAIKLVKIVVAVHALLTKAGFIVAVDVTSGQFLQAFAVWKLNYGDQELGQQAHVVVEDLHLPPPARMLLLQ